MNKFDKDKQYYQFCAYGFLKNLRFYDAFLLLFFLENGISYSQIGVLYAAREITMNIFEIPSGIIADSYGRKRSLLAAFLAYILSFFIFYTSTQFVWLLLAMLLYGMGDAFRSGTHKGMIMDYLKLHQWEQHKVEYYGSTRAWSQKGSAVSALFAGVMVFYTGSYRIIYLISIVPYLLNFANIFTYPAVLNHAVQGKKEAKQLATVLKDFRQALFDRRVFQVMNSAALHSSFLKASKDYIQPIMYQLALLLPIMSTIDIKRKSGLVIGLIYFFIFLLTSYASQLSFRVAELGRSDIPKWTLLLGLACGSLSGFLVTNEWWLLALLAFMMVFVIENLRKPILTATLSDHIPNKVLTTVFSAQSFYSTLVTAGIAVSLGLLADRIGIGYALLMVSVALVALNTMIGNPGLQQKQ